MGQSKKQKRRSLEERGETRKGSEISAVVAWADAPRKERSKEAVNVRTLLKLGRLKEKRRKEPVRELGRKQDFGEAQGDLAGFQRPAPIRYE